MPSRLGARLAALLVPAALVLPTPAHAEKVVTEDAVGDVLSLGDGEDLGEGVPAPDYAGVDVVRTAVAHGAQRLRVGVRFRNLERDPFQFTVIHVSTPQGGYELVVERLGGKPITSLVRGRKDVDCRGLKTKVDLGEETVTTSLPTSCLGAPRWVKVGVGAVALAADQASPELAAVYADDAHRDGEIRDRIAPGPKVHRG
jgi:hypothetical protein